MLKRNKVDSIGDGVTKMTLTTKCQILTTLDETSLQLSAIDEVPSRVSLLPVGDVWPQQQRALDPAVGTIKHRLP